MSASHKIYVIHGHGGNRLLMHKLAKNIQNAGYETENFGYPSFTEDIVHVSERLFRKITTDNYDTISFVTHSMGALIVRNLYKLIQDSTDFPVINKIVMIAPPNKGTPVADFFYPCKICRFLLGVNYVHLTTNDNTGLNSLPIPDCEIGLILGIWGKKHGYNPFLKSDSDGYILPERAILGVEKDIAYVKAGHTSLTQKKKVSQLAVNFLKYSNFSLK